MLFVPTSTFGAMAVNERLNVIFETQIRINTDPWNSIFDTSQMLYAMLSTNTCLAVNHLETAPSSPRLG